MIALDDDVERWRRETPGCGERVHLNNAGAALVPAPVLDVMVRHLRRESTIGGYEAADESKEDLAADYAAVARLIGTDPVNVAVVENATVAFTQALSAFDFRPGDVIVTSRSDYPSNQLTYLSLARRLGIEIVRADDLPEGGIDPEGVRELLKGGCVRLVAVSWVPTNSGLVQHVHAIGRICRDFDVPFLVDACQSVGQLPIDVAAVGCDFLAASARKFLRGPRGIGFLYVSDAMIARGVYPLYLDMRGADWTEANEFRLADGARRFENWEYAYALVRGLGEAARYALGVGDIAFTRGADLAARLRAALSDVPGVRVLDRGADRCAIVTAAIAGWNADELKRELRTRRINTSASLRTDGVIDMDAKGTASVLRISPHYYNTPQELDVFVEALSELAASRSH